MRFYVKDSNIENVPKNPHMVKLGVIGYGLREFWIMYCTLPQYAGKVYIEELVPNSVLFSEDVFGNFKFIDDDELAHDLTRFAESKNLTNIAERFGELAERGQLRLIYNESKKV